MTDALETTVSLDALLGYLNFSEGRPDSRFQKALSDAYAALGGDAAPTPWQTLRGRLRTLLQQKHAEGTAAFRDTTQASAVLDLAFVEAVPAYRAHHRDLLPQASESELAQPFFIARVVEAVLAQGGPWNERERILLGAIKRLNDHVGYRPVAVLENRRRGEPYEHEWVRPIPVFLKGAGAAAGRFHELTTKALAALEATSPDVLTQAGFELSLLDELAWDPRGDDFSHPAQRRPNHVFGAWDPHHLDSQGRYRRYVARPVTLEVLLEWVESGTARNREERLVEAGAVLGGTILMATALSGQAAAGPEANAGLASLVPKVARCRDDYYASWLKKLSGAHGERLRAEATKTKQAFGGVRSFLNQALARKRALQLQQKQLTLLWANLGYPERSRTQAEAIPVASVRTLGELYAMLTTARLHVDRGAVKAAAELLPQIEDHVRRGIGCGALADPWNILGFQGQYPISAAAEDSVRDNRVEELLRILEFTFHLYARLRAEAAAKDEGELETHLRRGMHHLADWWRPFAAHEVSDVTRINSQEEVESADHVVKALSRWREHGAAPADIAFWRRHLDEFRTPKAFALVVSTLLDKQDYTAAMGLLMGWLSDAETLPLEEGIYSFPLLASRWLGEVVGRGESLPPPDRWPLVQRFFRLLGANAVTLAELPELEEQQPKPDAEGDDRFAAAYEGVTYRDTTDDGQEGAVADDRPLGREFAVEGIEEGATRKLRFLLTQALLWQRIARRGYPEEENWRAATTEWREQAREHLAAVRAFLRRLGAIAVPEPLGQLDAVVEYDRRRTVREQLLQQGIAACVELTFAVRLLTGLTDASAPSPEAGDRIESEWEPLACQIERRMAAGNAEELRRLLPEFAPAFRQEPLLYVPLDAGGDPLPMLRARVALVTLRNLVEGLPRIGLLRESFHLLRQALAMEGQSSVTGRRVTEFDRLFQGSLQAVVNSLVESAEKWPGASPLVLVRLVEAVTKPFRSLWVEHSRTLRLSVLEAIQDEDDWQALRDFIRRYGRDLFNAKFMTLGNLRGILHRGVGDHLDALRQEADPLQPVLLIDELDHKIPRERAIRYLQIILQAVVDNYEEYKDYNTTTAQSDYGDNLHLLLDFLRLKGAYERNAWHYRPLLWAHEALALKRRTEAARMWQEQVRLVTQEHAEQHLRELERLEQKHSLRLATVADRLRGRFVSALDFDRLCAWVEPAVDEATKGQGDAAAQLQEELAPILAKPAGVGLDLPEWLRRLEHEVQRVRLAKSPLGRWDDLPAAGPHRPLTVEELRRQIQDWDESPW